MRNRVLVVLPVVLGALCAAPTALAATLSVDDDGQDCPAAPFASIQAAIDAADPGDVVAICPGQYGEGSGAPGSNGLTINKNLTLRGAGADLVRISPARSTPTGGQIADEDLDIGDGHGDVIAIVGGSAFPITVNIEGVTVDGNGVYVEAGVVYIDAQGYVFRSRVTNVVTTEAADGFSTTPGAWRGPQPGYAIAQVTNAGSTPPGASPRLLQVENVRVDRYNRAGIFIDGSSVIDNRAAVNASEVVGRILCQNFAADGNCSNPGLVTTGPLFGQDGLRAEDGARLGFGHSQVASNLINGTGAPVRTTCNASGTTCTNNSTGNADLDEGAGVRLVGADAANSAISGNNIVDNAYGVINVLADGTTANPVAVPAENNWWGLRFTGAGAGNPVPPNPGPAISPTVNPPIPENPVNGSPVADGAFTSSSAVDFIPYRSGPQSSPTEGQFANVQAPMPMEDAAPTAGLDASPAEAERGATITLTATGGDDFGVKSVTFYDGSTALGTDNLPPYTQSFTVPQDAACAARTFTAVVEDSSGQTTSASDSVTVTGPNNCQPPEPEPPGEPAPPAAPTVTVPEVNGIGASGTTVTVDPNAPAGVAKVEWFLGNRLVCTVTSAPFTCTIVPTAADVGLQTLRIVVTDKLGRTAVVERQVLIREFKSRGITIRVVAAKAKRKRIRRTITARLLPPVGMSNADACTDSTVTLVVNKSGRPYSNTQPSLDATCSVRLRLTSKRAKRRIYSVSVRFPGNQVLLPTNASRRFR